MAEAREGKAEEFKRVLTTAMKTIADDPELTVSYTGQPSSHSTESSHSRRSSRIARRSR